MGMSPLGVKYNEPVKPPRPKLLPSEIQAMSKPNNSSPPPPPPPMPGLGKPAFNSMA